MKKALIAIISAIYVVAIIIVSFLGAKSEISNRVVYAEEIVLLNEDVFRENLPKIENNIIIDVYKRKPVISTGIITGMRKKAFFKANVTMRYSSPILTSYMIKWVRCSH